MDLSEEHHQENVPRQEYQWRLCVYYKKLNQVTRLFDLPIPLCDDTMKDIDI